MKRINITCPACGSRAYLRPASVVYGDKAPDPDAKYYVCGRYPACDCYVAAHRKTMLPMGTLADKALRKKRHDAHVALDSLWKNGVMSRKEAYRLLQLSMGLPAEEAHIAKFSAVRSAAGFAPPQQERHNKIKHRKKGNREYGIYLERSTAPESGRAPCAGGTGASPQHQDQ